ncbi:unnamed protein product [Arabidopsis lyrata]|uniref:Predicted protein n=1 Tax=Arabidopsis lyrata subsp. lyrata TaxID=81972 RepID=D7LQ30_ARALL|nr:predicted protein [Arabidopsis lyrata subsp. lyrata]CAH8266521.1 unnamed protein product [Arabidopsis lyrata]
MGDEIHFCRLAGFYPTQLYYIVAVSVLPTFFILPEFDFVDSYLFWKPSEEYLDEEEEALDLPFFIFVLFVDTTLPLSSPLLAFSSPEHCSFSSTAYSDLLSTSDMPSSAIQDEALEGLYAR